MIILIFVADTIKSVVFTVRGSELARIAVPFERINKKLNKKILVVGDSTAVGTGSRSPELSTAGLLADMYPDREIQNLAKNGLKLAGLIKILKGIDEKEKFSIILAQIGANDIIRFGSMAKIEKDAEEVFELLSTKTDKLLILHSGDVGRARFFPFYLKPFLSYRSRALRKMYLSLAKEYKASYVDLYSSDSEHLLRDDPKRYYASDMLHLNSEGYGLWFNEIQKAL